MISNNLNEFKYLDIPSYNYLLLFTSSVGWNNINETAALPKLKKLQRLVHDHKYY